MSTTCILQQSQIPVIQKSSLFLLPNHAIPINQPKFPYLAKISHPAYRWCTDESNRARIFLAVLKSYLYDQEVSLEEFFLWKILKTPVGLETLGTSRYPLPS